MSFPYHFQYIRKVQIANNCKRIPMLFTDSIYNCQKNLQVLKFVLKALPNCEGPFSKMLKNCLFERYCLERKVSKLANTYLDFLPEAGFKPLDYISCLQTRHLIEHLNFTVNYLFVVHARAS
jgi:hypothetical protein